MRKPLTALSCLLLVAACGVLPKREPIRIFTPTHAAAADSSAWPQANWALLVAEPIASQTLDSESISVRPSEGSVHVYKGASWADPAPDLVQAALMRRFEDSGKILSVARPGVGINGQYQLLTELRSFEAVYANGAPQAVVELQAKLVDARDGHVIAARAFTEREPAAGEDVEYVVQAFSRALDRSTAAVAGWTLVEGNRHEAKHASGHGEKQ